MRSLCVVLALVCAVHGKYTPNPHLVPPDTPATPALQFLMERYSRQDGLPRSYKDILPDGTDYWGTLTYTRVGALDYQNNVVAIDSEIAIQERTLVREGLNLYDASTWQIALSLWSLWDIAETYQRNALFSATTGGAYGVADASNKKPLNGLKAGLLNIRADSADMLYGKTKGTDLKKIPYPGNVTHYNQGTDGLPVLPPVKKGPGAFFFRMIGPNYFMTDPYVGRWSNSWKDPWPVEDPTTTWNGMGYIHWNDWKPITGENVWACMIGPLQTLMIKTGGNLTNTTCGNNDNPQPCNFSNWEGTPPAVQLGITILPALEALLSPLGALYHCPNGSQIYPPDPEEGTNVSNENNFSAYAAMKMLQAVLTNYTTGSSDEFLSYGLTTVNKIITAMDNWLDKDLLSQPSELPGGERMVYQGGHVSESGDYKPAYLNITGGLAVDCQTWGMTVMGAKRMDSSYGADTAYNVWQATKKYCGYYKNDKIAGVGYTAKLSNESVTPRTNIWSAEWSFGAVNMAQVLAGEYNEMGETDKYHDLMQDAASMYDEMTKKWPDGLQFDDGSYVYANQRFFIPWGWYSNPIGALCSTAWSVMQEQNFNPFELGGGNKPSISEYKAKYMSGGHA
eukprot:NODE_399_length_2001_cov_417.278549_g392_i0.p1 GENE.NODE_399_length_2001_cov_417.278549_g392_i0~~NODE_399_length_2001_cov_417.278549_g392_i0.p1  ORF type:complete len:621 (+),score=163.19 NODE_399_length_2001_cov_417.278549_g392_i0:70-1932(+)